MLRHEGCKYCSPANTWRFLELEIAACVAPRSHLMCEVNCLMSTSLTSGLLEAMKIFLVSASGSNAGQLRFFFYAKRSSFYLKWRLLILGEVR